MRVSSLEWGVVFSHGEGEDLSIVLGPSGGSLLLGIEPSGPSSGAGGIEGRGDDPVGTREDLEFDRVSSGILDDGNSVDLQGQPSLAGGGPASLGALLQLSRETKAARTRSRHSPTVKDQSRSQRHCPSSRPAGQRTSELGDVRARWLNETCTDFADSNVILISPSSGDEKSRCSEQSRAHRGRAGPSERKERERRSRDAQRSVRGPGSQAENLQGGTEQRYYSVSSTTDDSLYPSPG